MRKILLYKCWNCGIWGDFRNDPECECGVDVYEESDYFSNGRKVETMVLDLHEAALGSGKNDRDITQNGK